MWDIARVFGFEELIRTDRLAGCPPANQFIQMQRAFFQAATCFYLCNLHWRFRSRFDVVQKLSAFPAAALEGAWYYSAVVGILFCVVKLIARPKTLVPHE